MISLDDIYSKAVDFINKKDDFLVIAHNHPDGDTLGSALGLTLFLKKLGKKATAVCKSPVPAVFTFLKGIDQFRTDFLSGDYQTIILVDNGDLRRTGFDQRIREYRKQGKPILNIDHHPANDVWKIAQINLVNQAASSSSEIIFQLIQKIDGEKITPGIATALLAGIYTDTGGFQHSTTQPETLKIAARLMSLGGRLKEISKNLSGQRSFLILKLWGKVLKRLRFNPKSKLVVSIITQADMKEIGCTEEDLAGVVNLINSASDSKAALLLYETKDGSIKGSLRTEKEGVDVGRLASLLGGGGHKKAAGFTFPGRIVKKGDRINIE